MNETALVEISEILDSFDTPEISRLLDEQINDNYDDDIYTEIIVNHFQPLYYNYIRLTKLQIDDDIREEAEHKFFEICKMFINKIIFKFKLNLSNNWIDENYQNLPAITLGFYQFFINDFSGNIDEFLVKYIVKNAEVIAKTFEGMKNKKDASTLSNKKNLSSEMTVIASNIYDIITWIFDNITVEDFLDYSGTDLPNQLIKSMYGEGNLSGDFIEIIRIILKDSVSFRSSVGFKILYKIKNGDIRDIFSKE